MIWLTSLLAGIGVAACIYAVLPVRATSLKSGPVSERMAFYGVEAISHDEELSQVSFYDRIIKPPVDRLAALISSRTPLRYRERIDRSLALAGNPGGLGFVGYLALRTLLTVVFLVLGAAIGVYVNDFIVGAGAGMLLAAGAWIGVGYWLRFEITNRAAQLQRALPDVLDFLVIAVDAGLPFDSALQRVVAKFHNPLTEGLALALAEVRLGRGRLEALEDFGKRSQVQDVASFVQTIASSERMGVPIAQALRIQAADARWRRGERAREQAARAPVRMTIPMVALIFPTIWLVILGPSLIAIFVKGI